MGAKYHKKSETCTSLHRYAFRPGPTSGMHFVELYDFFRVEDGRSAEHWDISEKIPPAVSGRSRTGSSSQ